MGDKVLALAIGNDETTRLASTVAGPASKPGVWVDMSFSGRMYGLFGEAIDRFGAFLPDADRQQLDAQRELYAMYAKWFRRFDAQVTVVAEGIDFSESVEFAAP
jgi:hypothetical protein